MSKAVPKWPLRFLRWFCDPDILEDIEGDLLERYEHRTRQNKPGNWLLIFDVLKLFRPGIIRPFNWMISIGNWGMMSHFFLLTARGFKKERSYTFINLLGLTVTFCVSLMIALYVYDQEQFDSYHHHAENKYRINYNYVKNSDRVALATTTYGLGPAAIDQISGIKQMVRVRPVFSDEGPVISNLDKTRKFQGYGIYYVEKNFLQMFGYPLAQGDPQHALAEPNRIVLTQESAHKFFGEVNPIGQQLHVSGGNLTGDFIISGVLDQLPAGTHLDFDYLIPIDYMLSNYGLYMRNDGWLWENFYTYFELEEGTSPGEVSVLVDQLVQSRVGKNLEGMGKTIESEFQPIVDIYLDPIIDGEGGLHKGNSFYLMIFSIVAFVLLVVASINFINLASARALQKTREVSLRKALGANRRQLLGQFLLEALCFNLLSIGLAVLAVYLLMPSIHAMLGVSLTWSLFEKLVFWEVLAGVILSLSFATGIYPALLSVKSAAIRVSGKCRQVDTKNFSIRKGLIVFQLMISLLLIAGTWIVYQQLQFMQEKELGMQLEKLFVVQGSRTVIEEGNEVRILKQNQFKQRLLAWSDIQAISATSNVPSTGEIWHGGVRRLGQPRTEEQGMDAVMVDRDFSTTYDFDFLSGRTFLPSMNDFDAVIINESALQSLGLKTPVEALNHSIVLEDMDTLKIWGVVKDVNWNSLHEARSPTIFCVNDFAAFLTIKINFDNLSETLNLIEETYRELYPNEPYVSFFLDREFNLQYESEQQFSQLFGSFSLIAIIISGLGILALVTFTLSQRIKEIGIRKVLGANARQLFQLLSIEYVQVLGLAILIGGPFILWGTHSWLNHYAYRMAISYDLFLFPIACITLITLLLITGKILRAMKVNPAKQLRDE